MYKKLSFLYLRTWRKIEGKKKKNDSPGSFFRGGSGQKEVKQASFLKHEPILTSRLADETKPILHMGCPRSAGFAQAAAALAFDFWSGIHHSSFIL